MKDRISNLLGRAASAIKNLRTQAANLRKEERELKLAEAEFFSAANKSTDHTKVGISTASVAKATLAIFGLVALAWFFLAIKNVIILFLIAAFFSVAFDPFVDRLQSWRVPRAIGILLIYVIFIGLFGIVISSFVPILATEIPNLVNAVLGWVKGYGIDTSIIQDQIAKLQNYLQNIQQSLSKENIKLGFDVLSTISQNAITVVKSIAGGVFSFIIVMVVTFFMVVEENGIKQFLIALFPKRYHNYIIEKATAVENKFGAWLRGQVLLMVAIGVFTFIALKIAGINYAATLATFAGLTELIPYVGPILALVPTLIVAGSQGGFVLAAVAVAIYFGIQQLEGNILVPLIMQKTVGLSPIVVMFAMLVGASFPETINPIIGIILSVPVATAIAVFVQDYAGKKK